MDSGGACGEMGKMVTARGDRVLGYEAGNGRGILLAYILKHFMRRSTFN